MKTPRFLFFLLAAFCLTSPSAVQAQPADLPFSRRAPAATVTADTIATGEIDLANIDISAALDFIGIPEAAPGREQWEATAGAMLQQLRDANVSKVYLTVPSGALMHGGLCVLFPSDEPESVSQLLSGVVEMIVPDRNYTVITRNADVIVCPTAVTELFKEPSEGGNAAPRSGIDEAIASVERHPHRFVFELPRELQSEMAALWPSAMKVGGGISVSPQQTLEKLESIAVGWSFPPEIDPEIRFICAGDGAAMHLHDEMAALLALLPPTVPRPEIHVDAATVVGTLSNREIKTFFAGAAGPLRQRTESLRISNSVKQLSLALHNFYGAYKFIPGKYTVDAEGKRLLSWRVALLPYLEENSLYEKFNRDEPWDSPHNRALLSEMPEVFALPGDSLPEGHTRIRLPVIEGSAWSGEGPPKEFKDITDGTSNTLWVAVAPESAAVPWTKPAEWELDAQNLIDGFFGDSETTIVGRFDGSVHTLSREIDPAVLQAQLTIAGGEIIDNDQIE